MRIIISLVAILVVGLSGAYAFRGALIKSAINNVGSAALGTEVSVTHVTFEPFDGLVALEGLKVANPQGYSNNSAIEVGVVRVQLAPKSLLKGPIQIQEVTVKEPKIRMEGGLKNNNLTALQANLPTADTQEESAPKQGEATADSRPVEIDLLQIADGVITITKPIAFTANLGTITLTDIGKEGSSTSVADIFPLVMNKIIGVGTKVVTSEIAQKGRAALDSALENVGEEAGGVIKSLGSKLKGLFGN